MRRTSNMFCPNCGKQLQDGEICVCRNQGEYAPQQQPSQQPYQQQYQQKDPGGSAFVCSLISLILCWIPFVGIVLGAIGVMQGLKNYKLSIKAYIGFILGIIGLVISVIILIASFTTDALIFNF